jgi:exosortase K
MTSIGHLNLYRRTAAQAAVVLLAALLIKAFYSTASVNELRWILWPTKVVVEWITGTRFYFESYSGYTSEDRSFVIAASCSGVNFLIAVFLMLSLRMLWVRRRDSVAWLPLLSIVLLSYTVTIGANALRISSALWLNSGQHSFAGLDREELHRLDGIMVYFGVLLLVYFAYERLTPRKQVVGWRTYVFPLSVYYAVTLAVPVMNGALGDAAFMQHSVFVLVTPVVLMGVIVLAAAILFRDRHRESGTAGAAFFPGDFGADQAGTGADV